MTLRKRLRVILAALRQEWHIFTCPNCHKDTYICGHAPDLRGMVCEDCEAEQFDAWYRGLYKKHEKGMV